jgi:hypothetical protein
MKLGTPTKLLLIVVTVLPIVYMALFLASIPSAFKTPSGGFPVEHFGVFISIHIGLMLLTLALLVFYIVFLFKTDAVRTDMKALWAVILFFGSPIAMPIFWYLYIWREPAQPEPTPAA